MKIFLASCLLFISSAVFSQTPDSAVYYFKKGEEEKTAKRFMIAADYFNRAIHFDPKYTDAYLENGFTSIQMRKTDEALQFFSKAYEVDPGNMIAGNQLMDLYFSYHQYQNAMDLAKKCKTCSNADRVIALAYFYLEDYAASEKLLIKQLQKNPADAELNYILGRAYLEMELEAKAIPYYLKAVELQPDNYNWLSQLGLVYYAKEDYKNAVVYFQKALDKGFTQNLEFNENFGFAYIYSGEFEKGEKLLLDVSDKKKGNKEILRELSIVYYERKMYDKSLDLCQKLMELDMKDGKALYQAGLCFMKKGQNERGQQMCDRAIELDPSLNKLRQKKMSVGL